jgi:hypothetical protein
MMPTLDPRPLTDPEREYFGLLDYAAALDQTGNTDAASEWRQLIAAMVAGWPEPAP